VIPNGIKSTANPAELAREAFSKAEKNTKRQWILLRKPRLIKAGNQFAEASFLYGQAGDYQTARESLGKAKDCFVSKKSWYCAAKTLEQIISLVQSRSNFKDADGTY